MICCQTDDKPSMVKKNIQRDSLLVDWSPFFRSTVFDFIQIIF
jgi:hypothetical protein